MPTATATIPTDRRSGAVAGVARQLGLLALATAAYLAVRAVTQGGATEAMANAHDVLALERRLGLDWETGAQALVLDHPSLVRAATPSTCGRSGRSWPARSSCCTARDRDRYVVPARRAVRVGCGRARRVRACSPWRRPGCSTASPTPSPSLSGQDHLAHPSAFTNVYAAMPSFHVGWTVLAGVVPAPACCATRCCGALAVLPRRGDGRDRRRHRQPLRGRRGGRRRGRRSAGWPSPWPSSGPAGGAPSDLARATITCHERAEVATSPWRRRPRSRPPAGRPVRCRRDPVRGDRRPTRPTAPARSPSWGCAPELLAALAGLGLRGADADPARGDPAAARGARPARARRPPAPARRRRSRCPSLQRLADGPRASRADGARARADPRARHAGVRGRPPLRPGARRPGAADLRRPADRPAAPGARARRRRRRRHAGPGARPHRPRHAARSTRIAVVVLDEADEMLDMGFAEDIEAILEATPERPPDRAVLGDACRRASTAIARRHLTRPGPHRDRARARRPAGEAPRVRQTRLRRRRGRTSPRRSGASSTSRRPTAAIVFCRTRDEVDQLTETLNGRGYRAEALHGGMTQEQRDRVMGRLRGRHRRPARRHRRRRARPRHRPAHPRRQLRRARRRPSPTCTASAGSAGPAARASRSRWPSRASTGCSRPSSGSPGSGSPSRRCRRSPTCAPAGSSSPAPRCAEALLEGELDRFRVVVESLADEFDVVEIALAAVKLAPRGRRRRRRRRGDPRGRRPARAPTAPRRPGAAAATGRPRARAPRRRRAGMARLFVGAGPQRRHPAAGPRRRDRRRDRPAAAATSAPSRSPTASRSSRCRPRRPTRSSPRCAGRRSRAARSRPCDGTGRSAGMDPAGSDEGGSRVTFRFPLAPWFEEHADQVRADLAAYYSERAVLTGRYFDRYATHRSRALRARRRARRAEPVGPARPPPRGRAARSRSPTGSTRSSRRSRTARRCGRSTGSVVDDGGPADVLWHELQTIPLVSWVGAGKLMAAKRPRLIPVYDEKVRDLLDPRPGRFWVALRDELVDDAGRARHRRGLHHGARPRGPAAPHRRGAVDARPPRGPRCATTTAGRP